MAPGIRFGWMECPANLIDMFNKSGIIRSGGAVNNYTSGIISSLIELGLSQKILNLYRDTYRDRMKIACDILNSDLPESCNFHKPLGGYFIWITLPSYIDTNEFNEFCKIYYKILFVAGDKFSVSKQFKNCFRITIGFQTASILSESIPKLCDAIREFIRRKTKG